MDRLLVKAPLECPDNMTKVQLFWDLDCNEAPETDFTLNSAFDERVLKLHRENVQKHKPDIMLVDFFSVGPCKIADELNIPVVINYPGPICIFSGYGLPGITVT